MGGDEGRGIWEKKGEMGLRRGERDTISGLIHPCICHSYRCIDTVGLCFLSCCRLISNFVLGVFLLVGQMDASVECGPSQLRHLGFILSLHSLKV